MNNLIYFISLWILITTSLLLTMYCFSLYYQYNQIFSYPISQCYNDYLCKQNINGKIVEINMSQKSLFQNNICAPLTNSSLCNFTYTNANGENVTEKPGNYINTWSLVEGCTSENNFANCPFYSTGDIYWRACYNNIQGNYYNNSNQTYGKENTLIGRCG